MVSSATMGRDKAKLSERLQRLKADLEKSKKASRKPAAQEQLAPPPPELNKIPFYSVSEQPAPLQAAQANVEREPSAQSIGPLSVRTDSQAAEQDSGFEVVSSPLDTYQENTGSSPRSNASYRQEQSGSETDGGATTAGKPGSAPGSNPPQGAEGAKDASERALAEEREQRMDLEAQVYALRQAYAETRDSSEGLGSEVSRLQREVENLRSQLQRASSTSLRQARQEEADNMRSRLERAEKAIEQERSASMKLRNQLEESQNQAVLNAEAAARFGPLQAALKEAKRKVQEGEKQVEELRQLTGRQESQIKELQSWKSGQQAAFSAQRRELEEVTAKLREVEAGHAAYQSRLKLAERDRQQLSTELQLMNVRLKQQIAIADAAEPKRPDPEAAAAQDFPSQPSTADQGSSPSLETPAATYDGLAGSARASKKSVVVPAEAAALENHVQPSVLQESSPTIPTIDAQEIDSTEPSGDGSLQEEIAAEQVWNSSEGVEAVRKPDSGEEVKPKGLWAFITGADRAANVPMAR